jgi:hypothetical protein
MGSQTEPINPYDYANARSRKSETLDDKSTGAAQCRVGPNDPKLGQARTASHHQDRQDGPL